MSLLRSVLSAPTKPLRRSLDRRVEWLISLVDDRLGRRDSPVHDRLDVLERNTDAVLTTLSWRRTGLGEGRTLDTLGDQEARYLNWAVGADGFAAQAGMWFNEPVPVTHAPGEVTPLLVNERIAEQPWVFAAVPPTPPQRVLDVGGSESTVALSLAVLGHRVDVVDPRGYALAHPNLTVHECRLDELEGAGEYDTAIALSAIEHFGLGHYEPSAAGADDVRAVQHLKTLVRPGGRLVLTVPVSSSAATNGFERTYDADRLDALLEGWTIQDQVLVRQADSLTWERADGGIDMERGVALVVATNPG